MTTTTTTTADAAAPATTIATTTTIIEKNTDETDLTIHTPSFAITIPESPGATPLLRLHPANNTPPATNYAATPEPPTTGATALAHTEMEEVGGGNEE